MSDLLGYLRGVYAALPDRIRSMAFSPTGDAIAVETDKGIWIVDAATGATKRLARGRGSVAWGPCGVVVASHDGAKKHAAGASKSAHPSGAAIAISATHEGATVFGEDGRAIANVPLKSWIGAAAGPIAAVISKEGIEWVNLNGDPTKVEKRSIAGASHLAISPDGARILVSTNAGAWEGPLEGPLTWLPEMGRPVHMGKRFAIGGAIFMTGELEPIADAGELEQVALSPADDRVAIAKGDFLQIIAPLALAESPPPVGLRERVSTIAVDDRMGRIATGSDGDWVCVWRIEDASLLSAFRAHRLGPPLAWAPGGSLLVGGGGLEVRDADTGRRKGAVPIPGGGIGKICVRGDRIYARGEHTITILGADLRPITTFGPWPKADRDDHHSLVGFDVSPSGDTVCVGRYDDTTLKIDVASGSITELDQASLIAVSDDLIALSTWGSSTLSRAGESRPIDQFEVCATVPGGIFCSRGGHAAIHAWEGPRLETQFKDGPRVVAASFEPPRLYTSAATWIAERQLADGQLRRVFASGGAGKVVALAFDPKNARLAIAEYDGRLHVWSIAGAPRRIGVVDSTTLQPEGSYAKPGELSSIESLAFPGALVAAGHTAMIWDGDLSAIGSTPPRTFGEGASLVSKNGKRFVRGAHWAGEESVLFDEDGDRWRRRGIQAVDQFLDISDDGALVLFGSTAEGTSELTLCGEDGASLGALRVEGRVAATCFTDGGDVLGLVTDRGPHFRWRVAAGQVERWADPIGGWPTALARGGKKIALLGAHVTIADETTGATLALLPPFARHDPTAVALSADGALVAIGSWHGAVRIYALEANGARCLAELSATEDGGWWCASDAGFTHEPGPATKKTWSAP